MPGELLAGQRAARLAVIGAGVDAGDADVVRCQEVFTYWHLRQLVRRMRSFRQVSYSRGAAGGLVTFSRRPVSGVRCPARGSGVSADRRRLPAYPVCLVSGPGGRVSW